MTKLSAAVFVHILWTVSAFIFSHHEHGYQSNVIRTLGHKRFEFVFSEHLYWWDASVACRKKGGCLAKILDLRTQTFIMDLLKNQGFEDSSIWIGLNDRSEEGTWVWDDGEPLQGYTNWASGETDHTIQHSSQDCVVVEVTDSGKWHDKPCSILFMYNYICEFSNLTVHTNQPSATTTTTTTTVKPSQTSCPPVDCNHTCPNGFSGFYVDKNSCIACTCI